MTKKEAGKYPGRDKVLLYIILFIFIGGGIFFFWFSPWYYGKEARKKVTTTIHLKTLTYIDDETRKCSAGESSIMNNTLNCSNINPKDIIQATIDTMLEKNAWQYEKPVHNNAVRSSNSNTTDEDVGYVNLSVSGSNIIIKTCIKTPCKKEENRLQASIGIK